MRIALFLTALAFRAALASAAAAKKANAIQTGESDDRVDNPCNHRIHPAKNIGDQIVLKEAD